MDCKVWPVARYNFVTGLRYEDNDRVRKSLMLMETSTHKDAIWLCSVFNKMEWIETRDIFHELEKWFRDPVALTLVGIVKEDDDILRRASNMGHPYAQASWACITRNKILCKQAMDAGESYAWYVMGRLYLSGHIVDKIHAGEHFQIACDMGDVSSIVMLEKIRWDMHDDKCTDASTCRYDSIHPSQYAIYTYAWSKGCVNVSKELLCAHFNGISIASYVPTFNSNGDGELRHSAFILGEELAIMGTTIPSHLFWIQQVKKAMTAWSVIGTRFGVVKDVRIMIAHMIWKDRIEWIHMNRPLTWKEWALKAVDKIFWSPLSYMEKPTLDDYGHLN